MIRRLPVLAVSIGLTWISIACAAAVLMFSGVAHADTGGAAVPTWSLAEVMALIALVIAGVGAAVDAVRAVLHFTAPRTASTLDDRAAAALDAFHDRLTKIEALIPNASQTIAKAAPSPAGIGIVAVLFTVGLGAGFALTPGCSGSTQATRAQTISSLDTGLQSATAATATYEHQHTEEIIAAATDLASGKAAIAAFRTKTNKVWVVVSAARAAVDAANTINDDASVAGAKKALNDAIAAVTALTGGTP